MRQKYSGDITIVPSVPLYKLTELISNPDPEMVLYYTTMGEKATWSCKLHCCIHYILLSFSTLPTPPIVVSTIKNHLQIELCIDEILYRLRVRKLSALVGYYSPNEKLMFAASKVELLDVDILRALQGRADASAAAMPRPPTPVTNDDGGGGVGDKMVDIDDGQQDAETEQGTAPTGLALSSSSSSTTTTTQKRTSSTAPTTPHSHRKSAFKLGFGFTKK